MGGRARPEAQHDYSVRNSHKSDRPQQYLLGSQLGLRSPLRREANWRVKHTRMGIKLKNPSFCALLSPSTRLQTRPPFVLQGEPSTTASLSGFSPVIIRRPDKEFRYWLCIFFIQFRNGLLENCYVEECFMFCMSANY